MKISQPIDAEKCDKSIMIIRKNDSTFHVAEEEGNSRTIGKKVGCDGCLRTDMVRESALRWASELRVLLTQPEIHTFTVEE